MTSLLQHFQNIRAERFFVFAGSIFGILFLFITPPFRVPDEPNHFYRAWQISEGGFQSVKQDNRVGGYLPSSLDKIRFPFFHLATTEDLMQKGVVDSVLNIQLESSQTEFYDFNNTAMYSPVCYLPSSLAILIFRHAEAPPLYAFYAARVFTLFLWICFIFLAIRTIPVYKWLLCLLALLPMSLFINMAVSADVVTNAICFLFIAVVINYAKGEGVLAVRKIIYLGVVVFLIASVKMAYAPLLLLLLMIPGHRFKSKKDHALKISLLAGLGILVLIFWNIRLNTLYISYENYHPDFRDRAALMDGADMTRQISYILHHGPYLLKVFGTSLVSAFDLYFYSYIGNFDWLIINLPPWFAYSTYLLILAVALFENGRHKIISYPDKTLLTVCFITMIALVLLSQLLIWVRVGGNHIDNIQGRYLIPCMPLLFMLFNSGYSFKHLASVTAILITTGLLYTLSILYSYYF
jgi:uncharacterized membrane protein